MDDVHVGGITVRLPSEYDDEPHEDNSWRAPMWTMQHPDIAVFLSSRLFVSQYKTHSRSPPLK